MQLKIQNGVVELSGEPILKSVNLEVNTQSKIGIVGRNGCGKTTLLKLISGEYSISKIDSDKESFFAVSGNPEISMLSQMTFEDDSVTMVEEVRKAYSGILNLKYELEQARIDMEKDQSEDNIKRYSLLLDQFTNLGGFYFEKEYEAAIKHFGFSEEEKYRPLSQFSGGQRTKIAFIKLLLSKPDILLLDEPTNHLDIEAVAWLEEYLREYKKAFVVVSHDRMFLDNVVNTVYEIEYGKTRKYAGNYTDFVRQKKEYAESQLKKYEKQQKEIEHLQSVADRFRYKATKAAMAQSKLKQIERIEKIEAPQKSDNRAFFSKFEPLDAGVKDVLSVKDLQIGFDNTLSTVNLEVKRGMRIGIIGGNGLGKSTFLKTIMGTLKQREGVYKFGPRVQIGYFDQQMAQYVSDESVLDDYLREFPALSNYEARSDLAAFLFSGEDVFKPVNVLSGGEKVRLALCKIFKRRPNFLILDEPTNHMDIVGKEALEDILLSFTGTLIFVSHDRYFIRKISDSLLVFSKENTEFFPYGYAQYLEEKKEALAPKPKQSKPSVKKSYTTPAKERAKRERTVKKAEEKIALLEERLKEIKTETEAPENISDYLKLSQLQDETDRLEAELFLALEEWEKATKELAEIGVDTGIDK